MVKEKASEGASTSNELLLTALRQEESDIYAQLSATEWQELIDSAAPFGVTPLLYERLRHTTMPEESRKRLRAAYQRNTFSNFQFALNLTHLSPITEKNHE